MKSLPIAFIISLILLNPFDTLANTKISTSGTTCDCNIKVNLTDTDVQFKKQVLFRAGKGKDNVIQGIALDISHSYLYSLNVTGRPEKGVINRFIYSSTGNLISDAVQTPSDIIGHQGLSIIPADGGILASAGESIANKGWHIVKLTFAPGSTPLNVHFIKIFEPEFKGNISTMPTITPDGDKVIIRGVIGKKNILRIYQGKAINYDLADWSHGHFTQWQISPELTKDKYVLQAMTTDGKNIFLLSGGGNDLPKRLFTYDFDGKLIAINNSVTLGKNEASLSGIERHWEPEGMAYDSKTNNLLMVFAIGDHGTRKALMFRIPLQ